MANDSRTPEGTPCEIGGLAKLSISDEPIRRELDQIATALLDSGGTLQVISSLNRSTISWCWSVPARSRIGLSVMPCRNAPAKSNPASGNTGPIATFIDELGGNAPANLTAWRNAVLPVSFGPMRTLKGPSSMSNSLKHLKFSMCMDVIICRVLQWLRKRKRAARPSLTAPPGHMFLCPKTHEQDARGTHGRDARATPFASSPATGYQFPATAVVSRYSLTAGTRRWF